MSSATVVMVNCGIVRTENCLQVQFHTTGRGLPFSGQIQTTSNTK